MRTAGTGGFGPSGKIFRDIGKFGGEEDAWAEWALKFRTTVKEYDAVLFQALEMAGDSEVEIDMTEVAQSNVMDRCMEKSAMLYNRFVHLLSGPALTLHAGSLETLEEAIRPEDNAREFAAVAQDHEPKEGEKSQDQSLGGVGQHVEA